MVKRHFPICTLKTCNREFAFYDLHFTIYFAIGGKFMSLNVPEVLIQQAKTGTVDEAAFVQTIRESLPYAWQIVEKLASRIHQDGQLWDHYAVAPPSEQARGQLLRMVGGDAIRGAVERHFNVKLAFQNCHNLAAFRLDALNSPEYRNFTSIQSQILNQTPELKDC